ncbi:conserved hypothetical protein [Thermotomaculum hydrothermale]|uniref:DUF2726 domain-containing protein n=1 Tax=Thermotomaculum hydrothermale TaxID=981385 RepID=A0A7R6PIG7_9BACT|nr:DUF2726 domain-containing protein [Thermotomaculum hydrothermale]BBB33204.1 conserved hypothetical protein [Thermotomaculum hydrothermale]
MLLNLIVLAISGLIALLILIMVAKQIIKVLNKEGVFILKEQKLPYRKKKSVFTPAERSFYGVLKGVLEGHADIFAKIRVADILTPLSRLDKSEWQKAFNRISGKHFDFVICDKNTLEVLCVIELNDKSHKSAKRMERDDFLRKACESAGIPLLEINVREGYSPNEIRDILSNYVNLRETKVPEIPVEDVKLCPKCNSKMVIKVAKKGKNAGKKFWACSRFPECRYIEPID